MFKLLIQCLCADWCFFAEYSNNRLIFGWQSLIAVVVFIVMIAVLHCRCCKNCEKTQNDKKKEAAHEKASEKVPMNVEGKFSIDFTREQ